MQDPTCHRCEGSGEIVVCCDDLCHGAGQCMHGDGMALCPVCGGEGEIEYGDPWAENRNSGE